ncbi:MAG: ATP-dependent DNA helicase, partial [Bifidobacteriaceae bacterium]|nr:ATP-dependent DNA helicase [Bifidobacteriaceae bacterium]
RTFEILLGLGTAPGTVKRLRGNLPEKLREALQVLASEVRAAGSLVRSAAEAPDAHKKSAEAALQEVTEMSTLGSAEAVPKSGTLAEATQSQPESSVEDSGKEKLDPSAKAADVKTTATKVANAKVVWLSRSGLNGEVLLYAAPLDVADSLAEGLFGHATAVLTSATLSVAGGLEAAAARVGLTRGEWEGLDVGSPFDYSHQGILYVASDLPEPGRDAAHQTTQHERLEQLVRAAQGGTLGLFTSQKAAEAAAETLRERLEVPILVQGEKSLPALMEEFVADEAACLFGTNSLWQGIDAPGRTCRLVTVDRLAFPRPDDPVMSARAEAADRAGLNGFMTVSAAHAALMLAQGAGRLIRSVEDRGVVAVLDPRLATKRYGAFLLASMPPLWRTESLEVVTAALERLAGGTPDK